MSMTGITSGVYALVGLSRTRILQVPHGLLRVSPLSCWKETRRAKYEAVDQGRTEKGDVTHLRFCNRESEGYM